jgi:prophage regulatory protein
MKFIKLTDVMKLTGLSRSSIYLAISEGKFPKQVSLGVRSVAWVSNEIEDWMESCIANRGSIQ